jgi:hypothetical protein
MHAVPAIKSLGLISVFILASGLLFLVVHWPQSRHATFSNHAAAQRTTIWYYIGLFGISLPLLLIFFGWWFVPTLHLTPWFLLLALGSELLQHIVTIIPEVGGWKTTWHRWLTAGSSLLLLPMLGILLTSNVLGLPTRSVAAISLTGLVLIVFYQVLIANKAEPKNQLLFQAAYYGLFFVPIIMATYIG